MIRLKRLGLLIAGVAFAAIGLGSEVAPAQPTAYPERPIRVVYPYAPGGVGDNIMRLLAPTMERKLGHPLVIE
jgi:tripartite-type tricarboxylate transporter receptor subunit TctC